VQNVAQEGEIPRITHRDQNVSRFCLQSGEAEIAIRLHPELVELLGFAVPRDLFPVFGPGEQSKEDSAEDDAGNRGFIFGEQVDQRGHQQDAVISIRPMGSSLSPSLRFIGTRHSRWPGSL